MKTKLIYSCLALLMLSACAEEKPVEAVTAASVARNDIPTRPGFGVSLAFNPASADTKISTVRYRMQAFDADGTLRDDPNKRECHFDTTDPISDKPMICIVDVQEYDIYFNSFKLAVEASPEMGATCQFVRAKPYSYYNYPVGRGPTQLNFTLDAQGNATGCTTTLADDGTGAQIPCGQHPEITNVDLSTLTAGCVYDHSEGGTSDAPNCCTGSYAVNAGAKSKTVNWGGDLGKCIGGSLAKIWGATSSSPNPTLSGLLPSLIYPVVPDIGIRKEYDLKDRQPILLYAGRSDVGVANFHDGVFDANKALPFAVDPKADLNGSKLYPTNDSYMFECIRPDGQATHQIKLYIRAWDFQSDFEAFFKMTGANDKAANYHRTETDTTCNIGSADPLCKQKYDWMDYEALANQFANNALLKYYFSFPFEAEQQTATPAP